MERTAGPAGFVALAFSWVCVWGVCVGGVLDSQPLVPQAGALLGLGAECRGAIEFSLH